MSLAYAASSKGPGVATLTIALLAGWLVVAAPPSRRAVAAALESVFPPARTLSVDSVSAHRMELNGQTVLFVEGVLHNGAMKSRKAPGLKLALIGEDGRALYTWSAKAARPDLAPGADVAFQTRLAAPPERFKTITVAFDAP